MKTREAVLFIGMLLPGAHYAKAATLGPFTFNDSQFGNTLLESDGGGYSNSNWLNTVNLNPGNPAVLTGANFNTGIANIGLSGHPLYTIGYNTAIANGLGPDLGIVSARFSTSDTFSLAVSTDGINFTAPIDFGPELAVTTGVARSYFYSASPNQTFSSVLFVTPVDLAAFGLAPGATILATRITSSPEGDLIRVAGLSVPEPNSLVLISAGAFSLLAHHYRRRQRG
jgi:hypothetical protein